MKKCALIFYYNTIVALVSKIAHTISSMQNSCWGHGGKFYPHIKERKGAHASNAEQWATHDDHLLSFFNASAHSRDAVLTIWHTYPCCVKEKMAL